MCSHFRPMLLLVTSLAVSANGSSRKNFNSPRSFISRLRKPRRSLHPSLQ